MPKQFLLPILKQGKINPNTFYLVLKNPSSAFKQAAPGQFLEIKVSNNYQPLLRRPFSVHRLEKGALKILYKVVGQGTRLLSEKKAGDLLDVIGPLGNGFTYELRAKSQELPILVAGGMGVAPLMFLAEKLMQRKAHPSASLRMRPEQGRGTQSAKRRATVLIGAKTKSELLCEKEFKKLGCEVKIATDDGTKGLKGFVSELLKQELSTIDYRPSTIYACGPKPMLKAVSQVAQARHLPCQVSLEEHMACGLGVCLGCVVETKQGRKLVCKDGPVFTGQDIFWDK
jgi:dihydroorotate dehydrogenase electron transfer subunit